MPRMPMPPKLSGASRPIAPKTTSPAPQNSAPPEKVTGNSTRNTDATEFNGGVTAAGLNPLVPAALQKATWERALTLAETMAKQGKAPIILIDHRLTGLDDRPIIKAGLQELAKNNGVSELKDVDAALKNGTLKFLPGYTEQASDAWRAAHPELVKKYPGVFGSEGSRININFMGYPITQSNATAGLAELDAAIKLRTGGKGRIVMAGQGSGTLEQVKSIYSRPKEQGGAGLSNADVRFGAQTPSAEADAKAAQFAAAFEEAHPGESVPLDHDSRAKAGWVETLEREKSPGGLEQVVVAFADDRLHNRIAGQAASKLGTNMIAIKVSAPGISVAGGDSGNANQISTFSPNPA